MSDRPKYATRQEVQALRSATDRLYRRILMTTAAVTISATDDKGPVHLVQGKVRGTPETIDSLQTLNLFGFASHAPVGSDALVIFGNGDRSNGAIVATANQKARPRNQKSGEVTIFTDDGTTIVLKQGGVIEITAATTITINAPAVTIAGTSGGDANVAITGNLTATGEITAKSGGGSFVTLSGHVNHQGGGPNNPPRPGS